MIRAPIARTDTRQTAPCPPTLNARAWAAAALGGLLIGTGASAAPAAPTVAPPVTPAMAAAPLVVPAAAPSASEPSARDASADIAGVTEAVRNWAAAWSRKDAPAYIAAYVPGFKGGEASAAAWQAGRRERIVGKGRISVTISNIVVLIGKSQKSATFTQTYASGEIRQQNRKTLEFEQRDGRWLIVRETSATTAPTPRN